MTSDQSLWSATNLFQLPASVFPTIPLHPHQFLLGLKAVTIHHKTWHLLSFQWLAGSINSDSIAPWFVWFSGILTQNCGSRIFQMKQLLVLGLHRVYPCQNLPFTIMKETTIWRIYKRPTTLVWQVTKVNDKRPVALVGTCIKYTCT